MKHGGQEGKALEWWLEKQKNVKRKKSKKDKSANNTETTGHERLDVFNENKAN